MNLSQEIGYFDNERHSTGALTTRLATDSSAVHGVCDAGGGGSGRSGGRVMILLVVVGWWY